MNQQYLLSTSERHAVTAVTGLLPNEGDMAFRLTCMPEHVHLNPRVAAAGLTEGEVKRLGKDAYQLSLQENGNLHCMLFAEKRKASPLANQFIIRDTSDTFDLGVLTKARNGKDSTVTYSLLHRESQHPEVLVRYDVPTVYKAVTEGPTRRASVEVSGYSIFESKDPSQRNGQQSLNFRGRGKMASRKNMQLQDHDGKIVLQMVKWENDLFHLDFVNSIFDPIHAFAFALAQFDL